MAKVSVDIGGIEIKRTVVNSHQLEKYNAELAAYVEKYNACVAIIQIVDMFDANGKEAGSTVRKILLRLLGDQ